MRKYISLVVFLLFVPFLESFGFSFSQVQKVYKVDTVLDLQGAEVELPNNSVLRIGKKGKLVNGSLIGNNTKIIGCHRDVIGISLLGSWKTSKIYDIWFDKGLLTDNQIIDNINVLQSDSINQIIEIKRDYCYALNSNRIYALNLSSNTILSLYSSISIKGNNLPRYDIARIVRKENVHIRGGVLRGDVGRHEYVEGTTSEWGFALYVFGSKKIVIDGLTVELCTGDGIYITGGEEDEVGEYKNASNNILIKKCILSELRRDGIGLIHAYDVKIEDCQAVNMGQTEYTPPCYGINIEPNKRMSVKNVIIENFVTHGTYADFSFSTGGYQFDGVKSNRKQIVLNNCSFDKGIAVMSGGVTIRNTSAKNIAIYTSNVPKGEEGVVVFDNCTISGGAGIQFDGRRYIDLSQPLPIYIFRNSTITASKVFAPSPGLIWGTELNNVYASLHFKRCKLILIPGVENNQLTAQGLKINCNFYKCNLFLKDYIFNPRNNYYDRCSIECYSIDGNLSASNSKKTTVKTVQQ